MPIMVYEMYRKSINISKYVFYVVPITIKINRYCNSG